MNLLGKFFKILELAGNSA